MKAEKHLDEAVESELGDGKKKAEVEHNLYEDNRAQGDAGGETEGKSNIDLRAQADHDTDAVFANACENSQDDLDKEADAERDVGGYNCNSEVDVGNERSGRIESNDNRAASCGGISNTIEQGDLNINFDLEVKKNIKQVLTTVARRRGVGASLESRAEVVTNDQSAVDGLRVGEQADADEEEEERVDAREEHDCGCEGSCAK